MKHAALLMLLLLALPPLPAAHADKPPRLPLGEVVMYGGDHPSMTLHADGTSEFHVPQRDGTRRVEAGPSITTTGVVRVQGVVIGQVMRSARLWSLRIDGQDLPLDVNMRRFRFKGPRKARMTARVVWAVMEALHRRLVRRDGSLDLGPITIHDRKGPFVRLHGDGRVEESTDAGAHWTAGPTIETSGKVAVQGRVFAFLGTTDGKPRRARAAFQAPLPWTIREAGGTFTLRLAAGDAIELDGAGDLWRVTVDPVSGAVNRARAGRVEAKPALRRTAIWLLGLAASVGNPAVRGM